MDMEEEESFIEKQSKATVEINIKGYEKYFNEYEEIRKKTLDFIELLEKEGLKVENYSIKKKHSIFNLFTGD